MLAEQILRYVVLWKLKFPPLYPCGAFYLEKESPEETNPPAWGGGVPPLSVGQQGEKARNSLLPWCECVRTKKTGVFFFCWPVRHDEILQNLDGPCPAPTYLPTYLPYLWETKKEITGWVKVGYYTN